jgi:hypothetical protein
VKTVISNFNFKARGGDRELIQKVYRRRDTPKGTRDFELPVIRGPNDVDMFEVDPMGQKINALVNSPSKVTGVSVPAKKSQHSGDDETQQSNSDNLAAADNQPRMSQ